MTFRGVGFDGKVRLFADDAFRGMVKKAADRRHRDSKLVKRLLSHGYLCFDKARNAEERVQRERVKLCLTRVEHLKERLTADKVSQLGLEGRTGSPQLTPEILSRGHVLKCIDVDQSRLLISVQRHPLGGKGSVFVQYWLYDEGAESVRLLAEGDWMQDPILTGPMLVSRDGHSWEPIDNATEEDFLRQIESALGRTFKDKLAKTFEQAESGLISCLALPDAVVAEIKALTGVQLIEQEQETTNKRQAEYLKKYGPTDSSAPPGIYIVPGSLRIGLAPESVRRKP